VNERALIAHGAGTPAVRAVAARVRLLEPLIAFEYRLSGDLAALAIPGFTRQRRADRLWEHTCFEAFVAPAGGARYFELNFSPSTEWAAYAFDRYRDGMRPLALSREPRVAVAAVDDDLHVTAAVELAAFAGAPWPWRIGLTAVVEDVAGARAYYALEHPSEKPDFHDAAAFTVLLDGSAR
jgi:hypothetical protein